MIEQDNLRFWEEQASKYKTDVAAVNFDTQEENLEFHFLKNLLKNNKKICDFGCGNGRTIFNMIENGIQSEFHGVDITKGMINIANKKVKELNLKNTFFYNASATSKDIESLFDFKFDIVMSKRLLINIKGNNKYKAVNNIYNILDDNGLYIMIESFLEPLNKINHIREKLDLTKINVHHFNEYLDEKFLDSIKDKFIIEKIIDFESLYYFISRTFNAILSNGEPEYNSKINQIAVEITKNSNINFSGYSPQVMYILKKVT